VRATNPVAEGRSVSPRVGNGAGHGGPASGIPARQWAPFEPGNLVAQRHGAFSRFVLDEADELATTIAEHAPHLAYADAPALRDYAVAQARAWRLAAYVEEHGELDDDGAPRPALRALSEWLARAEKARARLGLDPASRAALAVDELQARRTAGALARDELAEGRRLRLEAEGRGGRS
jgi:hypothetical protein